MDKVSCEIQPEEVTYRVVKRDWNRKNIDCVGPGKRSGERAYGIDFLMIVCKYMEETEKNPEPLFASADKTDWIVFSFQKQIPLFAAAH